MKFNDIYIRAKEDLIEAVREYGFVPFFKNSIPGFSVAEHIDPAVWFPDEGEGIWEWKGPVIRESGCAYGKFFRGKAVFVSAEWFPDFANLRRGGLTFDETYDFGLIPYAEKTLYDILKQRGPITSGELKFLAGYGKEAKKGFDPLIAKLQHRCFALISDFVYQRDKYGLPYGWGVAQYAAPEQVFGDDFADLAMDAGADASYAKIMAHLTAILPGVPEESINKLIR